MNMERLIMFFFVGMSLFSKYYLKSHIFSRLQLKLIELKFEQKKNLICADQKY
jgi:hypothetical protein